MTKAALFEIMFAITALILVIGTPAAYLVAIYRHGLWDLDYVIKKTVQYAVADRRIHAPRRPRSSSRSRRWSSASAPTPTCCRASCSRRCSRWRSSGCAARGAAREPRGLREARDAVRGDVGVQRAGRRNLLHRRRAAAHGALVLQVRPAPRPADVWLRVGSRASAEASWPDRRTTARPDALDRRHDARDAGRVRRARCAIRASCSARCLSRMPANDPLDPAKEAVGA